MDYKNRPILKIKLSKFDKILEGASLSMIIIMWAYAVFCFNHLPERVPIHFDLHGNVDKWGVKMNIWYTPFLGTIFYLVLAVMSNYPERFNYSENITASNAEKKYTNSSVTIRILKFLISLAFVIIVIITNRVALMDVNMSNSFFPVALGILITVPIAFYAISTRFSNKQRIR